MDSTTASNDSFDIKKPPNGAWIRRDSNTLFLGAKRGFLATWKKTEYWTYESTGTLVLGATTRSEMGFGMLLVMLIWTGISIWTLYSRQVSFDVLTVIGAFLIGLVYLAFWQITLTKVYGKIEITLDENYCNIFTGWGKIGQAKIYSLDSLTVEKLDHATRNGREYDVLKSNNGIVFNDVNFDLTDIRYRYLLGAMRKILEDKAQNKNFLRQGFEEDLGEHLLNP